MLVPFLTVCAELRGQAEPVKPIEGTPGGEHFAKRARFGGGLAPAEDPRKAHRGGRMGLVPGPCCHYAWIFWYV
jgi:hypothetical protein